MTITARGLNRSTLARQSLTRRAPTGVAEAVRGAVAVQAQSPASPYLALWNRIADFDPADLDAAFADGTLVKSNSVRMTLHAVDAGDYPAFREATEPSLYAAKLGSRIADAELAPADAAALAIELLDFAARTRTARECEAWLAERLGAETARAAWPGIRQYAPLLRAPNDGPWAFGDRAAYVAPPTRPTLGDREVADKALEHLVVRYLEGFGPASVADVAQFAMVQRGRARAAMRALDDRLERLEGPGGEELYDVAGAERADDDTPAPPRLMPMWDNVFLAYHDRSRTIPAEYRKTLIRVNGDVLPMLLVDGYAAGVWRATDEGIEATAFHPLPEEAWEGLAAEARSLSALLAGRDPKVYGRYHHWWAKLPDGEARVLPVTQATSRRLTRTKASPRNTTR